jgi:anthraniloyl-CoA monooxygenase
VADGHPLLTNMRHLRGSQWLNFPIVRNASWYHDNVVLIGDAAHTAHFSIGRGRSWRWKMRSRSRESSTTGRRA